MLAEFEEARIEHGGTDVEFIEKDLQLVACINVVDEEERLAFDNAKFQDCIDKKLLLALSGSSTTNSFLRRSPWFFSASPSRVKTWVTDDLWRELTDASSVADMRRFWQVFGNALTR